MEKIDKLNEKYYHILKVIAQKKGDEKHLRITSGELASLTGMSQQNASRIILEMGNEGIREGTAIAQIVK